MLRQHGDSLSSKVLNVEQYANTGLDIFIYTVVVVHGGLETIELYFSDISYFPGFVFHNKIARTE